MSPNYIDKLIAALDIRPAGASGADANWAPVFVLCKLLQRLDGGHEPAPGSAVDAFLARLRELVGCDLPWLQGVAARLDQFRTRV